jgi:hypothetical protein
MRATKERHRRDRVDGAWRARGGRCLVDFGVEDERELFGDSLIADAQFLHFTTEVRNDDASNALFWRLNVSVRRRPS